MIGLYLPGRSPLHRMPAGPKLLMLLVVIIGATLLRRPWQLIPACAVVLVLIALAGAPWRQVAQQLRPMRWLLAVIAVLQVVLVGWQSALLVCGGLLLSVATAALISLTTRVSAMLDLCRRLLRPLGRFGVDPDRVGLALALTIRCIPLMSELVSTASDARKARGLGFSLRALVVPVVVRALRAADGLGEALAARGWDD